VREPGKDRPRAVGRHPPCQPCEIVGGRDVSRCVEGVESVGPVPSKRLEGAASCRPDDQFILAVGIQIEPGDAGSELAELFHQQRLPLVVREHLLTMDMPEPIADIAERRRGRRPGCHRVSMRGCRRFSDLIEAIGPDAFERGDGAAAPANLNRQHIGCGARREDPQGVTARQVVATAENLLHLKPDGAAQDADKASDSEWIWGAASQADGQAWRAGLVAEEGGAAVDAIESQIEIAIVVEIRLGDALRDPIRTEPPSLTDILEGQILAIAQRLIRGDEARIERQVGPALLGRLASKRPNLLQHVPVLDIEHHPVSDQDVLESVQIDIEENRQPGPIGCDDTGIMGDLSERVVAPVHKQRVAPDLGPVLDPARFGDQRPDADHLPHAKPVVAAHHLGRDKIQEPVAVDIGEIDTHRGEALLAHRQARQGAEAPGAVVDPDPVNRLEIVADVDVRRAVAVQIPHLRRQTEVQRRRSGRALLVAEKLRVPRHRAEPALAVIEIERVGFADLFEPAIDESQPFRVRPADLPLAVDQPHLGAPAGAQDRDRSIICHVEVEVAVAVHIPHRQGGAAGLAAETGPDRGLEKTPIAVILETTHPAAKGRHQQIQIPVAVRVAKRRAGRMRRGFRDARLRGHVLESPIAQVAVQSVCAVDPRKEQVAPAVGVEVARRHARAVHQIVVVHHPPDRQRIGERDAAAGGRDGGEADVASARRIGYRRRQLADAESRALLPVGRSGGDMGSEVPGGQRQGAAQPKPRYEPPCSSPQGSTP